MNKILLVQLSDTRGGIESFIYNLSDFIDHDKYHISVVGSKAAVDAAKKVGANIDEFIVLNTVNPLSFLWSFIKLLKYDNFSVIHFNKNSLSDISLIVAAKIMSSSNVIIHSHNTNPSKQSSFLKALHFINRKIILPFVDGHIACSNEAGIWMFGSKSFAMIPNGINVSKFKFSSNSKTSMRKKLGIKSDDLVITNIGRFTKQKNQKFLISHYNALSEVCANIIMIFVGDGPKLAETVNMAKQEGIYDNVRFIKTSNNVKSILAATDLLIMPSLYEGLPISAIEAQAAGCEVLLSDKISRESEIIQSVNWFSLNNESEFMNAFKHCYDRIGENRQSETSVRTLRNNQLLSTKYNEEIAIHEIEKEYTVLMNR